MITSVSPAPSPGVVMSLCVLGLHTQRPALSMALAGRQTFSWRGRCVDLPVCLLYLWILLSLLLRGPAGGEFFPEV